MRLVFCFAILVSMDIYTLQNLPINLYLKYADETDGQSAFSVLQSSQTGNTRVVTKERLQLIKESREHIMLIAVAEGELMGEILGQRVIGISNMYFYIHDLVVSEAARGQGLGTQLLSELLTRAKDTWPEIVRVQCTSRPSRNTGPFFIKNGFRPRTKEAGDETIVYVKDFEGYTS
jgi:ribosomal protein S18 acetylase RimI-like enzyme